MFYRGGAEQKIRKYLVDNNFVDAVIQMPDNLFYGTSIATCLLILKRNRPDDRVTFIDASRECVKVTNANKLTEENIQNIYNYFMNREDVQYTVSMVDTDRIAKENYNLSVSMYVEKEDTREKVDIVKLNAEIKEIVAREETLRREIDAIIAEIEGGQTV